MVNKTYKVTTLPTNKLGWHSLQFLKSLGWVVIDGWTCKGDEPVEVCMPDRTSIYITDSRFNPF